MQNSESNLMPQLFADGVVLHTTVGRRS